jgi:hypothetical protein
MVGEPSDRVPETGASSQVDAALRRLERLPLWPWEREVVGDQLIAEAIQQRQTALGPGPPLRPSPAGGRRSERERH